MAKLVSYSRSNTYNILERESLDFQLLARFSEALNFDFQREYQEESLSVSRYLAVIKTNELKINELTADNNIELIYKSRISE